MDMEYVAEINGIRSKILGFIGEMFADIPKDDDGDTLYNIIKAFADSCGDSCPEKLIIGLNFLETWIKEKKKDNNLNSDFTKLFCVGKYTIGSTASYYLSEQRINRQKSWEDAVEFYLSHGYKPIKGNLFYEDSACAEILFLSGLALQTAKTTSIDDISKLIAAQIEFYDKHINIWFNMFSETVRKTAGENSFYYPFMFIAEGFLEADRLILDDFVEDINS